MRSDGELTHIDEDGNARMVDIGKKDVTKRTATASCILHMKPETLRAISEDRIKKGNVLTVAKIAGICAAKKTGELIPLCHPLSPEHIDIEFHPEPEKGILKVNSSVSVSAKTGAEMEALQAVAQAALTVYDMCKAVDRGITITELQLIHKDGGKSGEWKRE
jgi:cyclic pyranopterin phosphate synthase